jgi:hypothetical protein
MKTNLKSSVKPGKHKNERKKAENTRAQFSVRCACSGQREKTNEVEVAISEQCSSNLTDPIRRRWFHFRVHYIVIPALWSVWDNIESCYFFKRERGS